MPIEFACIACGQLFERPDEDAGRSATCPCGAKLLIPPPKQSPDIVTIEAPSSLPPAVLPASPAEPVAADRLSFLEWVAVGFMVFGTWWTADNIRIFVAVNANDAGLLQPVLTMSWAGSTLCLAAAFGLLGASSIERRLRPGGGGFPDSVTPRARLSMYRAAAVTGLAYGVLLLIEAKLT